jgi:hypothetical protein
MRDARRQRLRDKKRVFDSSRVGYSPRHQKTGTPMKKKNCAALAALASRSHDAAGNRTSVLTTSP